MNEPLTVSALARSVWQDFRRAWGALVVYEALFKLVEAWLLVPAVALALALVLSWAGHVAVSNLDVLAFLGTPLGLLYAALFSTDAVGLLLLEQAGIMAVANRAGPGQRPPFLQALRAAFPKALRIVALGALQAALLALAAVPFVVLGALTYVVFLSEHDFYFYWTTRPAAFWLAACIGGVLLLTALAVGVFLCVRWALALPIVLFENQFSRAALRASRERVRGVRWRVGLVLFGWLIGVLLLGAVAEAGFRLVAATVLANAGERPIVLVLLLAAHGGLLAALSFVAVVGIGLIARRLYLFRVPDQEPAPGTEGPGALWARRLAYLAVTALVLAPLALLASLPSQLEARPAVQVTAHRGHARAAPENTLSAIRKAIDSGADYAEVDVHQTADGVVVLLHDRDLKRVAGVSRRLDELTYAEVRKLDVGSWFSPAFAGERVPTLAEAIHVCRGRIKLNIELKFFGRDRRLAREVARILREAGFEPDCLVTSFEYDALLTAKRDNPRLRTGLIVAHALGDVSRVEVDVLSVRADWLSDRVLRDAHRHGREVHVWTVNDPGQMTQMMKRGVDNIITSDPDLAIQARDEWASLTGAERLVLASRLLLGLGP
jgi:glycerophosphoryl diester phosphodiesterase